MRPRTLARKSLQPVMELFDQYGEEMSFTGYSYLDNASIRASLSIENNREPNLVVCALLYDLDELFAIRNMSLKNQNYWVKKDRYASDFIKPIFDESISKPLRLKSVAQKYGLNHSDLDKSSVQLFEESEWFFSSMELFHLNRKLYQNQNVSQNHFGSLQDFEEILIAQTRVIKARETNHA